MQELIQKIATIYSFKLNPLHAKAENLDHTLDPPNPAPYLNNEHPGMDIDPKCEFNSENTKIRTVNTCSGDLQLCH